VAAVAEKVLSSATPTDPPTCCIVFTSAEATPASSGRTSPVAVAIAARPPRRGAGRLHDARLEPAPPPLISLYHRTDGRMR
jgi:hypothetical protein